MPRLWIQLDLNCSVHFTEDYFEAQTVVAFVKKLGLKNAVPTIFKRGLPETKKLRCETDTAATTQDTQDKGKSPQKLY